MNKLLKMTFNNFSKILSGKKFNIRLSVVKYRKLVYVLLHSWKIDFSLSFD
jgi:hypothetical protein